jgi:Transposase DDE domain
MCFRSHSIGFDLSSVRDGFKAEIGAKPHYVTLVADEVIEHVLPIQTGDCRITLALLHPRLDRNANVTVWTEIEAHEGVADKLWSPEVREKIDGTQIRKVYGLGFPSHAGDLDRRRSRHAGRAACPSVVILDGQSVKTTERGGARGFDTYKRIKGRKRHILVDTLGLLITNRVEPADTSDRRACALLLGGLRALFPRIRTVITSKS